VLLLPPKFKLRRASLEKRPSPSLSNLLVLVLVTCFVRTSFEEMFLSPRSLQLRGSSNNHLLTPLTPSSQVNKSEINTPYSVASYDGSRRSSFGGSSCCSDSIIANLVGYGLKIEEMKAIADLIRRNNSREVSELKKKVEVLQHTLQEHKASVHKVNEGVLVLIAANSVCERERDDYKRQCEGMKSDINELRGKCAQYEEEARNYKSERDSLYIEREVERGKSSTFKDTLDGALKNMEMERDHGMNYAMRLRELQSQVTSSISSLTAKTRENEQLKDEIEQLQFERVIVQNDYQSALVNQKAMERELIMLYKVLEEQHYIAKSQWLPDDASDVCLICDVQFGLVTRKHHCRSCGKLVCSSCSRNKKALPQVNGGSKGRKQQVRVCDNCVEQI
jgi:hypothetical protein